MNCFVISVVLKFVCMLALVLSQVNVDDDTKQAVDDIFKNPVREGDFLPGYEEVSSSTGGSIGALEKCGEGSDQGIHACVPYYQCDGDTNMIVRDGLVDGFGIINIRFGENTCPNYLEVCCGIPQDNTQRDPGEDDIPVVRPPTTSTQKTSTEQSRPTTPRPSSVYCGIRNPNGIDFKITGNRDREAEYGEFPWMVAILKANYDSSRDQTEAICGGSLLSLSVVLTGAHCVNSIRTSDIKIRAGEWDTQTTIERLPYQERNVARIIIHEQFHPKTVYNDVALLILDRPLDMADNIGPICLPRQDEVITSRNCFATGWGKDVFGKEGRYQVILKKIELPIVPFDRCQSDLRQTRLGKLFQLHDSFICAGGEAGKDVCTGDGGSPLVCPDPVDSSRYVQAGIVSWGIGCGEQSIPGVYANVARFRHWIEENLNRMNLLNNGGLS